MKLKLLAAVIVTAAGGANPNPGIVDTDSLEIYFDQFGPYEKYQNPCPTFEYRAIGKTTGGGNYTITIMFGDDKVDNRRTIQQNTGYLKYGGKKTFTATAPTNICLGDGGMKVTFKSLNNDTGKTITVCSFTIYPRVQTTVNPLTLSGGKYVSSKIVAKRTGTFAITYDETYDFSGFLDYFLTDTYYSLSLDQYVFSRKCTLTDFSYQEANLYINGGSKYFPGLSYSNDVTKIPLTLSKNGNKLSINFANTMYVEPKLLMMSMTPRSGYIATNHFFFPVNHNKDLEGLTFTFEIVGMGYSGLTARWDSSYLAINGLLGSCQNSEYCVDGEISQ